MYFCWLCDDYGPLARYVKLRVAHAPGMPGTFSPPPTSNETAIKRSRHASRHVRDARAVMHVGIANMRWWGKRSRHSRGMRNTQFCVSDKRPIGVAELGHQLMDYNQVRAKSLSESWYVVNKNTYSNGILLLLSCLIHLRKCKIIFIFSIIAQYYPPYDLSYVCYVYRANDSFIGKVFKRRHMWRDTNTWTIRL